MLDGLQVLFPAYPSVTATTSPQVTATTTAQKPGTKKTAKSVVVKSPAATPPVALTFHDETVANHDVRIYRDSAGRSILLYGYWNQTTLIIARDPAAFTEIVNRLANVRTQS